MWIGSNVCSAAHWEGENDTDNGHPCHPLTTRVGAWHQRVAVERSTEVSPQPAPTPRNLIFNGLSESRAEPLTLYGAGQARAATNGTRPVI